VIGGKGPSGNHALVVLKFCIYAIDWCSGFAEMNTLKGLCDSEEEFTPAIREAAQKPNFEFETEDVRKGFREKLKSK
jgi:hypothetical protein